ncbi:MAG: exopolysaccharide biosynthesis protein [Methylotenera sp.]|nr:exopolysaccharide biosynthesis protein [Methylotenera sp.]
MSWIPHNGKPSHCTLSNSGASPRDFRFAVKVCLEILDLCRKISKPRYPLIAEGRRGQKIGGFILLAAGGLMAIPFGVLPFNNFLPGLAILFYCIGELEDDGLMYLIAFFWLIITVIYFTAFFFALWYFGEKALGYFGEKALAFFNIL